MHNRTRKQETGDFLELTLPMYMEQVKLHLSKQTCLKCNICSLVCPRQAIAVIPDEETLDITIDPRRCVFCEICAHFCPVRAISLTLNARPKQIFLEHHGLAPFFPKLIKDAARCPEPCRAESGLEIHWCRQQRKLIAEAGECPKNCRRCLDACPRQVFKLLPGQDQTLPELDLCLRCGQCLNTCEYEALEVNPQIIGHLVINYHKCPPDCQKCINLCPVQAISRQGEQVLWRLEQCAFCGVCLNICDQEAISLIRQEVVAEPGKYSLAWTQAVARLLGT